MRLSARAAIVKKCMCNVAARTDLEMSGKWKLEPTREGNHNHEFLLILLGPFSSPICSK